MAVESLTEVVTDEVATNLEEVAAGVRRLNPTAIGYLFGGIAIGAVVGFYFGHRWNKEKIKAEAFKQSEREVAQIREVYAARNKPTVEEVVEARGYSTAVDAETERPTRPPVVVKEPPVVIVPPPVVIDDGTPTEDEWDYEKEVQLRTQELPYIIHQDEFEDPSNGYDQTVYTYWAADDVLTDAANIPLPHADQIVGQENLKFGHGSLDNDIVYVRNDNLELEMEITRVPLSYEQEILGLHRNDESN